jgi:hypothetical protein
MADGQPDLQGVWEPEMARVAPDRISYEATIEDPKVYTRPWKVALSIVHVKEPVYELMEEACIEGNRDVELLLRR